MGRWGDGGVRQHRVKLPIKVFEIDTSSKSCCSQILPIAYCLLPIAFCLLPLPYSLLPTPCSLKCDR
ncbi:hypothetical protein BJP36_44090 [Moorena producens JHB]|uniref:Uncharacterized protein n=1 Tax=Moorena producens (strain JHB) TaxID=1454205 RepID=A0A9Q9STH4_MOOP1|nr:hypothetical protein [Moorena producens]WAN69342.1 hypothetical protein BJP36_44090 [Moorena producens JHB]